jgi:effector-binding domain-containing protein
MEYEIQVKQLQRQDTAVIHATCGSADIGEVLSGIFSEVMAHIAASGVQPAGGAFGRYEPAPPGFRIEAGFTVTTPVVGGGRVEPGELPGGEAATCLHVGPYDTVSAAYEAVESWMRENGREAGGPPWEVYLTGPEVQPPQTEVVFPLRPR